MKARIEEVLSRILSEKYGAKIEIEFEEREDEQRRDNCRTGIDHSYARKRDR
jgi:hypothetical protein